MREWLTADESDAHGPKITNLPHPFFQIVNARMRPAVIVFGAISAVQIALVRHVQTALQRLSVFETLSRFQDVVAGEFAADFVQQLHAVERYEVVYGLLSAMQLIRRLSCSPCGYLPKRSQHDSLFL